MAGAACLALASIGSLCLALAVLASVAGWARQPDPGPIYTVARIQEGLRLQPGRWVGRRLRVRGLVVATCGIPDAQMHDGNCLIAQPGEPSFGLVDRTSWDPDVDLKRSLPVWPVDPSLPVWPVDPSESLYGSLLSWLRVRPAPLHQLLSMQMRVYVVTLHREEPCQALAWARPCGMAELAM